MLRLIAMSVGLAVLAVAQGPWHSETRRFERKTAGCVISFEYPEITLAAPAGVRDRINAAILGVVLRRTDWPAPGSGFRSLDAFAKNFLDFCEQLHKESKEFENRALYEHKTVKYFRSTPPIVSLRCDAVADTGGVHPFGTAFYLNFDSKTGRPVTLIDIVKPGALPQVESVAELHFREEHGLSAKKNLSDGGFSFPGDRFGLNGNFGVGEKALVFHFNTYEIAGGAMGDTDIEIPYTEISRWLKPGLDLER